MCSNTVEPGKHVTKEKEQRERTKTMSYRSERKIIINWTLANAGLRSQRRANIFDEKMNGLTRKFHKYG